jgi:hypothetical protein
VYSLCPPSGLVKQCLGLLLVSSGQASEMAARPYSGSFSSLVPLMVSHPENPSSTFIPPLVLAENLLLTAVFSVP